MLQGSMPDGYFLTTPENRIAGHAALLAEADLVTVREPLSHAALGLASAPVVLCWSWPLDWTLGGGTVRRLLGLGRRVDLLRRFGHRGVQRLDPLHRAKDHHRSVEHAH